MVKQAMVIPVLFAMLLLGLGSSAVMACDHPGTPDQVQAEPISATAVRLHWRNTTDKAGGSDDMWFDISVRDSRNQPVNKDIAGGAMQRGVRYHQLSSFDMTGLQPDTEYRFQMRARTEARTSGCLSEQSSNLATTHTPTAQIDATCTAYANSAMQQVGVAKAMSSTCPQNGPRWTDDRSAHYGFCIGTNAGPGVASEQKARDDAIGACRTNAPKIVRLRQTITTPSGTALGGWAELELHSDGVYFFRGHMHDSGAEGYKFNLRAAISSKDGIAIVATKSGSVEGTSTLIDRQRNFDWNDQGQNDLLLSEWDNIQRGTFQVAKAYKGSITGSVPSILTDLLTFVVTDVAFGPEAGVVVFLSKETTSVTGSGSAGTFVFAGGLAWLVSPTAAIPVFIGEEVLANTLVKSRRPSAEEWAFARTVFGDTLPPISKVTLTNIGGKSNRAFVFLRPDGTIQMNLTNRVYTAQGGPMRALGPIKNGNPSYPVPGELFVHELTHAWQLHNRGPSIYQWVVEGVTSSNYAPLPATRRWRDNNIEQQATIVNQWFERYANGWTDSANLKTKLENASAVQDPYFKFVKDNLRLGQN